MREILYSGKRVDNGEWVYGWYAPLVCNDKTVIPYIRDINGTDWKIIPETAGQYIGRTDKNGKKIFEGHIVRHPYLTSPQVVHWNDEWCAFGPIFDARPIEVLPLLSETDMIEVIGNIHDNPELLEDDQ